MFKKRVLSLLLAVVLCATMLPGFVLAADGTAQISVTFRLIGDGLHSNGTDDHGKYVTWIPTTRYNVEEGSTVMDLLLIALRDNNMSYDLPDSGWGPYLAGVQAPAALGGYMLGEFENGSGAGWTFMVGGAYADTSMDTTVLKNGGRVIVHYVDDYEKEIGWAASDWGPAVKPLYPNRWQEAADVRPNVSSTSNNDDDDNNSSSGSSRGSSTPDTYGSMGAGVVSSAGVTVLTDASFKKAVSAATNGVVSLRDARSITPAMLRNAGRKTISADTMDGKKVLARLTFDPSQYKGKEDIILSVRGESKATEALLGKYFDNNIRTIVFGQKGDFGVTVRARVKMDLTGLDLNNLILYSYDNAANTYAALKDSDYVIDKNGYLHFTTTRGNTILVTDRPLRRKAA